MRPFVLSELEIEMIASLDITPAQLAVARMLCERNRYDYEEFLRRNKAVLYLLPEVDPADPARPSDQLYADAWKAGFRAGREARRAKLARPADDPDQD